MSITKYVHRLCRMHALIRSRATGCPDEFARKLAISRRTLLKSLEELKMMGCQISYCRYRQSYTYLNEEHQVSGLLMKKHFTYRRENT